MRHLSSFIKALRVFSGPARGVGTKRACSKPAFRILDSAQSDGLCMDWRNKRVHFRIRDVYIPEAEKLVMKLHGDDLLQGTVVDVTRGEGGDACYAMIKVPGLDREAHRAARRIAGRHLDLIPVNGTNDPPVQSTGEAPDPGAARAQGTARHPVDGAADLLPDPRPARRTSTCARRRSRFFAAYGVPAKDRWGEVCALFDWVHRNIRYTRDIFRVELLHTRAADARAARRRLRRHDDPARSACCISTGHPVRLVLAGFRPNEPHAYSHIYPEVNVRGRWIALTQRCRQPDRLGAAGALETHL